MARETLCRICLESGATISIFEGKEKIDSVFSKLYLCLNEEIQDIEGYPRNICNLCQITLNSVNNFIKTYRASCKLLEGTLIQNVKQEFGFVHLSEDSHDYDPIDENIQPKNEVDTQYFIELLKPNNLTIKIKTEINDKKPVKSKKKKVDKALKNKGKLQFNHLKNRTNAIAASILEGDYVWNGDLWRTSAEYEAIREIKVKGERQAPLENLPKPAKPPREELPKLCDLCGKIFRTQHRLKDHQNKVHTSVQLQCDLCNKTFLNETFLNYHKKRIHETKKDYICPICGKGFAFSKDSTNHYRIVHLKKGRLKKNYPCSICKKNYTSATSLLIHERSAHTGERPAVCSICQASFYHQAYLREHMRLHTGQTPYKCPICGRGYAQRGNMKSHIRHNHKLSDIDPVTLSTIKPSYLKHLKA